MTNVNAEFLLIKIQFVNDTDPFSTSIAYLEPARGPVYSFSYHLPLAEQIPAVHRLLKAPHKVDECALQIYRFHETGQGDFGTYLDSDLSLAEQPDEVAILKEGRTSVVLRTNLCVRVHNIIEKMLNSTGRELRRALFSLKQTFQDDKDLVHEFVQNDGLSCLIKVGAEADQNYQNYILRALGQVMLYVDGMNGVIAHNDTIQWLYSLLASPFRLVVKTALKLLLVFVEYTESNSLLLLAAVYIVDKDRGALPWSKLMQILNDKDNIDIELFIYTMTLINKTLNAIPDQDTFYDVCDSLDQQKMDSVLKRLTTTMANKDLTEQCRIYENLIKDEDGDENFNSLKRPTTRKRMSSDEGRTGRRQMVADLMSPGGTTDFRRSSYNTQYSTPMKRAQSQNNNNNNNNSIRNINNNSSSSGVMEISRSESLAKPRRVEEMVQKTETKDTLQISREKVDEPVLELNNNKIQFAKTSNQTTSPGSPLNKFRALEQTTSSPSANKSNLSSPDHSLPGSPVVTRSIRAQYSNGGGTNDVNTKIFPPKSLDLHSVHQPVAENGSTDNFAPIANGHATVSPPAPRTGTPVANGVGYHGNHKHSLGAVHSLAEKFQTQNHATPKHSSTDQTSANGQQTGEEDGQNQDGTFAAALSIARKCKKIDARDPLDTRKESEIQWEKAIATLNRPLVINDLDFTELDDYDDCDPLRTNFNKSVNGGPPPPPPLGAAPPLPPGGFMMNGSGYHTMHSPRPPSPPRPDSPNAANQQQQQAKDMKTVKLFWKEAQTQAPPGVLDKTGGVVFWQKVKPVQIDSNKLICLFETKSNKDMSSKKKEDKKTEIRVLDTKRSNAINIGLTKLPPPRAINAAILKFDSSVMNKECIEKILCTMMPTEEEKEKILDSKAANPDIPLGSAEQFLILLSEIPALFPRLKLWLFMLDYANLEREVAEPLMDLKVALHELENCRTFQYVLATLLSIGNVLNGIEIKGFQLDFLSKVPEVKDTVNKHSLVYHLCNIVMEKFPDSTDLYSELGAVIRCAKVDFDEVRSTLDKTETDCKHSWDHLRDLIKHEPSNQSKNKISEFLMDSAQRILTLKVIHTRVMNRFRKFLIYMGSPAGLVRESKVNNICKTVAEFSLEYRTCRDKIVQQRKRIQDKRERNKTRGKLIIETRQWSSSSSNGNAANGTNGHHHLHGGDVVSNGSNVDQKRHCELSKLLKAKTLDDAGCNSYPGARLRTRKSTDDLTSGTSSYPSRYSGPPALESHDVGDDEILDGLVKAATIHTDHMRERRRARHFNRKSLRRTRTVKLDEDEQPGPVS